MARQIENQIVVTHYPRQPFGKHAGTYSITTRLGMENYEDDPVPLSGCTLDDPLSDSDKARLCALSLARIDLAGRFAVDYAALRAHLRTLCGVRDEDLHGLAWSTIMALLGEKSVGAPLPPDGHRRYERPMSKREIGIALGLDPDDRKIAEKVDSMLNSWGGQLHKVNRTNYLLPLDVLPPHFMDRFRHYVKDFHHVDL